MDVASLIKEQKFAEAFHFIKSQISSQEKVLNVHKLWVQIYETGKFDETKIEFTNKNLSTELHETIRIYIFLSKTNWDKLKAEQYKQATKQIILRIANKLRTGFLDGFIIDPNLMIHIQDLINIFDSEDGFVDKADLSAVKAQISGTLLQHGYIEKYKFGSDMLQYANSYNFLKYTEKAKEIFEAITRDFAVNSENLFKETFPEVRVINDNTKFEKYIYEKAKYELNKINGIESLEPEKVILDKNTYFYEMTKIKPTNAIENKENNSFLSNMGNFLRKVYKN